MGRTQTPFALTHLGRRKFNCLELDPRDGVAGATVSEQVAVIHPCLYKDVLGTTGEKKEDVVGIF